MESQEPSEPAPTGPAPAPAPLDVDDLRVGLRFEVGELPAALGVVRGLRPGHVFELDANPECPVVIRANGVRLATGRLVLVGTRLGVVVSEVLTRADQP